jgi:hypothetical protein
MFTNDAVRRWQRKSLKGETELKATNQEGASSEGTGNAVSSFEFGNRDLSFLEGRKRNIHLCHSLEFYELQYRRYFRSNSFLSAKTISSLQQKHTVNPHCHHPF